MNVEQFRNRLTGFLVFTFVGMIPLFLWRGVPESNKDFITYMLGQLSGMALMALGHYFTDVAKPTKPEPVEVTNNEPIPVKEESNG